MTDLKGTNETISLRDNRSIQLFNLYNPEKLGTQNDKLDPRAGRLAVHHTTIKDFNAPDADRKDLVVKDCDLTDDIFESQISNIDTYGVVVDKWGSGCIHNTTENVLNLQGTESSPEMQLLEFNLYGCS